jgi:hypothetical protein
MLIVFLQNADRDALCGNPDKILTAQNVWECMMGNHERAAQRKMSSLAIRVAAAISHSLAYAADRSRGAGLLDHWRHPRQTPAS